jgi:hypothetical protein
MISTEVSSLATHKRWDDCTQHFVSPPITRRTLRLTAPPVQQLIGIALVARENATALSTRRTHGSGDEEATDIQGTFSHHDAILGETSTEPAGHGYENQGASPAASPGIILDRDTTTESFLASAAHLSEPASRRPSSCRPSSDQVPI